MKINLNDRVIICTNCMGQYNAAVHHGICPCGHDRFMTVRKGTLSMMRIFVGPHKHPIKLERSM